MASAVRIVVLGRRASYHPIVETAPLTAGQFLASQIGHLTSYWLGVTCPAPCTKITLMPLKLLASKRGPRLVLGDVIRRLRCENCGGRPARAWITDNPIQPDKHIIAETARWRVPLFGVEEADGETASTDPG